MKKNELIHQGVLPDTCILNFIENGWIKNAQISCIQPASIDVFPDLNDIFEVDIFSSPKKGEKISDMIIELYNQDLARKLKNPILIQGKKYMIRLREKLCELPFYARMNPKSSPGRLFLHSRMLTDGSYIYDEVYPNQQGGDHWLMLSPKCFSIELTDNEPLSQLRFFKGSDRLSSKNLEREMKRYSFIRSTKNPELFTEEDARVPVVGSDIASNLLTVDMESDIVAYSTKKFYEPILLSSRDIDPKKYFDFIYRDELSPNGLLLIQGVGYLLGSSELIKLPGHLASEVVPFSEKYGELRSHYAGYIDPGFGLDTPCGNSITFEVISHESGISLRHRQPIAEIQYEYMSKDPKTLYKGNYKNQTSGPKLPKYFK